MAAVLQRSARAVFSKCTQTGIKAFFSTSSCKKGEEQSFFQKLWDSPFSPHTDAHSKTLTANPATYEIQVENVKPEFMDEYTEECSAMHLKLNENSDYPGKLVGSWTTLYGDLDQAVHLWVYEDGYSGASREAEYLKKNKEINDFMRKKGKWIRSRSKTLCHEFSFWGEPEPRKPSHIYEMRSYALKPGTLIEWGNKWGQAIDIRRQDAVAGFFSQVGDLYVVHHIWAYNDMAHRKVQREKMWEDPGWDDCVAQTVPLVRHMKASIMVPMSHSPMQ